MGTILKDKQETSLDGLIKTKKGPLVLLFFDGYDLKAREGILGNCYSFVHHRTRNFKRALFKQQSHTGFYSAFLGLIKSLESIGCDVRINDFNLAKKHPSYPIGIAGFPSVLDNVTLCNPKIFGPGDYGLPEEAHRVVNDPSFIKLIQPSDWFSNIYKPYCGGKTMSWFSGIDSEKLVDLSCQPKEFDFLIYDKIHWNRASKDKLVINRIKAHLDKRGLAYKTIHYGKHRFSDYLEALSSSKALLYVNEHETQGLAYQEALASNIPVLAWDEQKIIDPKLAKYNSSTVKASSVPYFDDRCGMRFKIEQFESTCDAFISQLFTFKPREYIQSTLSLEIAGKRYLSEYKTIMNN
ncbi:glycosyltransferase [Vibrio sp. 10N.261.55.A7]|uniref:glycosyltransferase n=1 Tax=Vibrio sp. 10N.261.55.A7 TaxID=1880851 RepID=UPI000C822F06|nr:glycosyltransferase [Vibrio sp. 10N.261.55.A7]PMJ99124.1 hypothetical protein BCU12_03980 [Vibrio sp. 10N.261.55.A7]